MRERVRKFRQSVKASIEGNHDTFLLSLLMLAIGLFIVYAHDKRVKYSSATRHKNPLLEYLAKSELSPFRPHAIKGQAEFRNWGIVNPINGGAYVEPAWRYTVGSRKVIVAVIDTGIDPNHPDIKPNLWHEKRTNIYGWDFITNRPNPIDDHSHGTHVAGILGAVFNRKAGVSGVAHEVSIMALKYYSEKNTGFQNLKNSIKALNWAIDHGANVINYSGGGPEFSIDEYSAIKRAMDKGIMIIAAAGNERQNADLPKNYYYPCSYTLDNVICVAAINIHDELVASSNWGQAHVDVAAPGENILSSVPGGKYAYMSGTSQATAFVTGAVILIQSLNPFLTPREIKGIINSSVRKLPSLAGKIRSEGKIDVSKAVILTKKYTAARKKLRSR